MRCQFCGSDLSLIDGTSEYEDRRHSVFCPARVGRLEPPRHIPESVLGQPLPEQQRCIYCRVPILLIENRWCAHINQGYSWHCNAVGVPHEPAERPSPEPATDPDVRDAIETRLARDLNLSEAECELWDDGTGRAHEIKMLLWELLIRAEERIARLELLLNNKKQELAATCRVRNDWINRAAELEARMDPK